MKKSIKGLLMVGFMCAISLVADPFTGAIVTSGYNSVSKAYVDASTKASTENIKVH